MWVILSFSGFTRVHLAKGRQGQVRALSTTCCIFPSSSSLNEMEWNGMWRHPTDRPSEKLPDHDHDHDHVVDPISKSFIQEAGQEGRCPGLFGAHFLLPVGTGHPVIKIVIIIKIGGLRSGRDGSSRVGSSKRNVSTTRCYSPFSSFLPPSFLSINRRSHWTFKNSNVAPSWPPSVPVVPSSHRVVNQQEEEEEFTFCPFTIICMSSSCFEILSTTTTDGNRRQLTDLFFPPILLLLFGPFRNRLFPLPRFHQLK